VPAEWLHRSAPGDESAVGACPVFGLVEGGAGGRLIRGRPITVNAWRKAGYRSWLVLGK